MAIDYKEAGVDVEAGYSAVKMMKEYVKSTYDANVVETQIRFRAR